MSNRVSDAGGDGVAAANGNRRQRDDAEDDDDDPLGDDRASPTSSFGNVTLPMSDMEGAELAERAPAAGNKRGAQPAVSGGGRKGTCLSHLFILPVYPDMQGPTLGGYVAVGVSLGVAVSWYVCVAL